MKEEKYFYSKIIENLNKFNLNNELINKNVYINWFFIPKPHPLYLSKYEKQSLFKITLIILINFTKLFISIFKSIFNFENNSSKIIKKDYDLVIVSHHISSEKIFEKDIYFKDIYAYAKTKNLKVLFIYLNHNKKILLNKINTNEDYFFLKKKLNFKDEFLCFCKLVSIFFFYLKKKI